jgi:hypothetical protein
MIMAALQPEQAERMRAILRPFYLSALEHGSMDEKWVWRGIETGKYLPVVLWEQDRAVGALLLELTPDAVHVVLLGGELPTNWKEDVIPMLKELAKDQGRQAVQCDGRKAWERVLAPFGFERKQAGNKTFMRIEL